MNLKVLALAAATLSAAALPNTAEARCYGCYAGAGIIGGIAAGAIIGSALAGPRYYYGPPVYAPAPVYGPAPVYYAPEYVEGPVCHIERQRFWDGYGWRGRNIRVCN